MKKQLGTAIAVTALAVFGLTADTGPARSQAAGVPAKMVIGIYAPTVDFADSAARLQYVKRLAKAVEAQTGSKVDGQSFASLGALKKAKVDFAIVDAQCVQSAGGDLLANGEIGGKASRPWALYSRVGGGMPGLKGQKISYVTMGCRDKDFVLNAMLDSEVPSGHFSGMVGKPTLQGAVAEVASFKGASAVFAPGDMAQGLTKVFDTGSVPGPAFVVLNKKLGKPVINKVEAAVVGFAGQDAISGWGKANGKLYDALKSSMAKRVKKPVFASPPFVRLSSADVIKAPKSLSDSALTEVKQHFEEPAKRQRQ